MEAEVLEETIKCHQYYALLGCDKNYPVPVVLLLKEKQY